MIHEISPFSCNKSTIAQVSDYFCLFSSSLSVGIQMWGDWVSRFIYYLIVLFDPIPRHIRLARWNYLPLRIHLQLSGVAIFGLQLLTSNFRFQKATASSLIQSQDHMDRKVIQKVRTAEVRVMPYAQPTLCAAHWSPLKTAAWRPIQAQTHCATDVSLCR